MVKSETRVDCFGDSATEEQSVPFVTPELCIQKGCCYDDMYMDEPETIFYKPPGRTWCFKKKAGGMISEWNNIVAILRLIHFENPTETDEAVGGGHELNIKKDKTLSFIS